MEEFIKRALVFLKNGTTITPRVSTDTVKLLNSNATALSFGSSTEEGGNIVGYRNSSGDIGFSVDMDAASNAKGLYCFAGGVFSNYVTIGQEILNTTYLLYVNGAIGSTGAIVAGGNIATGAANSIQCGAAGLKGVVNNMVSLPIDITISTGSVDHAIKLKIDGNDIFLAQATGDGAGGVIDLKAIINEQLVYTPSGDIAITAANGITVTKAIMRVAGDGGAIDITADPQIAAGTDGQIVIIQGTHDTNTVTLDDGTGLALSAQCVLAAQDNITLMYDSGDSEWIETSRTTVI